MADKWDMLEELIDCRRIQLGNVEKGFIIMFFSHQPTTAYDICLEWERTKASTERRPVSYDNVRKGYKNVHKRVKRFKELKLIEEISRKYPKNAKPYRLTTRGLFQAFLLGVVGNLWDPNNSIFTMYRENSLLQILLYQYFEIDTIMKFNDLALPFLSSYLQKCCEAILSKLEEHRRDLYEYGTEKFPNEALKNEQYDRLKSSAQLPGLLIDIDLSLQDEMRNFIYEIVRHSALDYLNVNRDQTREPVQTFPIPVLIKDEKFMDELYDVKRTFDEGCKLFF